VEQRGRGRNISYIASKLLRDAIRGAGDVTSA
jgi:hypothetical protein